MAALPGRIWIVRQGQHLAELAPAFRALGLEVRVLERGELEAALQAGPRPHAVLDSDLAGTDFRGLTARGIPVVALMLDHWYFSVRHRSTPRHLEACARLGVPTTTETFVAANFRPRAGGPSQSDRLYVFPCDPDQVPVFQGLEGVRHAETLLFGVDPERFRPLELTPEERARHGAKVGFVGASLLNNPIDGVSLIQEAARSGGGEAGRLASFVDELIALQSRDPFRFRLPELLLDLEKRRGLEFLGAGEGMTPEKETWVILLGVRLAAVQRVAAVQALAAATGITVHGLPEWALMETPGMDFRGMADREDGTLARVINATDVNVNVSKPMFPTGVGPRVLETLACGGFLLSNRLPALEALFEDGRDLAYFDSLKDLVDRTRHYLAHPEERRAIGSRGRARVLAAHTWAHRARRVVQVLEADGVLPV